jgi:uncharacterized protein
MLKVDLDRLARERRVRIDEVVPADDPLWHGLDVTFTTPVTLQLVAQQAGADVVVRGVLQGAAELPCRRCLKPVPLELDEELLFVYRPEDEGGDADEGEVYPVPARAREVDLTVPVREHVLLAMPQYTICEEGCRGLCPRCGTNLNQATCDCRVEEEDPRWAVLRRLRTE